MPLTSITGKAEPALADVGPGLLKRQGEVAQIFPNQQGCGYVIFSSPALTLSPLQQESGGIVRRKHVYIEQLHRATPIAQPSGNQHLAAAELAQQSFHSLCGSFVVYVVEDQQPARMGRQPVEHRLGLGLLG